MLVKIFLPDFVCLVGQTNFFRRIVDDFRGHPERLLLNPQRRVHTGRKLELGLKAHRPNIRSGPSG